MSFQNRYCFPSKTNVEIYSFERLKPHKVIIINSDSNFLFLDKKNNGRAKVTTMQS